MTRRDLGVEEGSFRNERYLYHTMEGVPIRHKEVHHIHVQKNGFVPEADLTHDFSLHPDKELIGDVTVVRPFAPQTVDWAKGCGDSRHGRFMMYPEVCHHFLSVPRQELDRVSNHLSFEDRRLKRRFAAKPCFGSLASTGRWKGTKLAPFVSVDVLPSGEQDRVIYFPIEGTKLAPNWFFCYVRNLRLPSVACSSN